MAATAGLGAAAMAARAARSLIASACRHVVAVAQEEAQEQVRGPRRGRGQGPFCVRCAVVHVV